ncbi:alpha/beta hydrolase|uniref:Pimeloyl-ACP methyl ester carboxylesterase n=1 Tax=Dendrosporobacter quercicolus TaxID=146817 RepID=A0A1G9QG47_9FIRM|nr:alpha/beta hydrolase [Dendrosporobacter quercicolus]NSL48225.1 alpha/beta hydrolase [Dendrosporobacter quercicolus DSM 1736]SDM09731.1 Pimeloyl-ACP methyl ester carboxylesterase [Dendrosporobacter quercicolus]
MPLLKTAKTSLFYSDDGDGKPLIFIHGLGASGKMFEPQITEFSPTHRVICPDLRGSGRSGRLTGPVAGLLDRQCDDIADLMDCLGVPRAVVCGVSYGGVVTCHFALRYPEKVRAVIIVDSAGDTEPVSVKERLILISLCAAFWLIYLPLPLLLSAIRRQYRRWPLAARHIAHIAKNLRKRETVLQQFALLRANHTRRLHQLNCPVLGIVGSALAISLRLMQRAMQKIRDSELYVITNSIDPTNLCQPERFAELVRGFLNRLNW